MLVLVLVLELESLLFDGVDKERHEIPEARKMRVVVKCRPIILLAPEATILYMMSMRGLLESIDCCTRTVPMEVWLAQRHTHTVYWWCTARRSPTFKSVWTNRRRQSPSSPSARKVHTGKNYPGSIFNRAKTPRLRLGGNSSS